VVLLVMANVKSAPATPTVAQAKMKMIITVRMVLPYNAMVQPPF
jgi:hypothetical protein